MPIHFFKNILSNAVNKDRDGNIAVNNADDAVKIINDEKPETSTAKYSLWKVLAFPPTVRKPKHYGIPIKGIRKLHYFTNSGEGFKAYSLEYK